jgi:hypothetical protein
MKQAGLALPEQNCFKKEIFAFYDARSKLLSCKHFSLATNISQTFASAPKKHVSTMCFTPICKLKNWLEKLLHP